MPRMAGTAEQAFAAMADWRVPRPLRNRNVLKKRGMRVSATAATCSGCKCVSDGKAIEQGSKAAAGVAFPATLGLI